MTRQPLLNSSSKPKSGFTILELLITLSIIVILAALFWPATRGSREGARRSQCKNNLKQIGIALHNYHDVYDAFPPAYTVDAEGNRLQSWRTLILPYLDYKALYDQIDLSKPWDAPANAEAFKVSLPVYQCPNASGYCPENHTTYLAVVTSESCLRPEKSASLSEVEDGTWNTLMVMEVHAEKAVHWMSPRDASEEQFLSFSPETKLPHEGGFQVAFVDGSVHFVSAELSASKRRALVTISGNDEVAEIGY